MNQYSKGKIISFAVVNTLMTLLSILAIIAVFGLAFAFTPEELLPRNTKVFFALSSFIILFDGLKWLAYYFIIKKGMKLWYIFYVIYLLIFTYFGFYAAISFFIPLIYFILFAYVEKG